MELETIFRLLHNSGFENLSADSVNIYMEDPGCIVRSFQTFFEYAWMALVFITAILLAGWAWAMIRGSKNAEFQNLTNNVRNLILILGVISAAPVFVNTIFGGDLIGRGCKTIAVPLSKVEELLALRKAELEKYDAYSLYEEFDIYDSGATMEQTPYADAPLTSSGTPGAMYDWSETDTPEQSQSISTPTEPASEPISDPATTVSPTQNMTPVRAIQSGKDVIFVAADGTQYKQVGGTRAWRNKNPGNIRMSDFSRQAGAIGEAGGFAVFPDEQTGMQAIKRLLRGKNYNNLTIANAVSRYAPPSENNTVAYQRSLERITGLSINRRISELSDAELDKVANAIRQIEGWKPGQVVQM